MTAFAIILAMAAAVFAVLLTPVIARAARAAGALDAPGPRKIHRKAIPRIGGVVIVLVLVLTLAAQYLTDLTAGASTPADKSNLCILIGAGLVVFLTGLLDDLRGLGPAVKLLGQLSAALAVCICGMRVESLVITPGLTLHLGWWSVPLTVGWILMATNAVNLIDGLDALAAGICAICSAALAVYGLATGQWALTLLTLTLLGCLLGFLAYNIHPARIFLGDCGAMFLGFTLAAASASSAASTGDGRVLAITALALGVPILDCLLSILRRILERRSIFLPDRGHVHHQLLALGDSHAKAVSKILVVTGAAALAAVLTLFVPPRVAGAVLLCDAALLTAAVAYMLRSSLHELTRCLLRDIEIWKQKHSYGKSYEQSLLHLREATCFDQWWQEVCRAADSTGLLQLSLDLRDRNDVQRRMQWTREEPVLGRGTLFLSLSVRHRRPGPPLELGIVIPITTSLESAGLQATIFGRLIDEFSLADLPAPVAGPLAAVRYEAA